MHLGINNRVAVVTGGDSGIGLSTASFLLAEGVKVALTDQDSEKLQKAAQSLEGQGTLLAIPADLTQPNDVASLVKQVESELGAASILAHCAGITGPTGDFLEIDESQWQQAIEIDLIAAVRVLRGFLPGMRRGGWGRIVLIASEDAEQPYPEELPYCACKAAIANLAKGLSKAYAKEGILVNVVSPAFIATPMTDAMMEKRAKEQGCSFDEAVQSFLKQERPTLELARRGKPEEVAAAIAFLCSSHASFINGANLRVDGGSVAAI